MSKSNVITKTAFAELTKVSKGRVSQWISEGKLPADCFDGEGRTAKVIVDRALAALSRNLDPTQRYGVNGLATELTEIPAIPSGDPPPSLSVSTTREDEIRREKIVQAQMTTRKMAREEQAAAGRYVLTDQHRRAVGEATAKVMQVIEGGLSDVAQALAIEFDLPQRDVVHALRRAFKDVRARAAAAIKRSSETESDLVEDEIKAVSLQ